MVLGLKKIETRSWMTSYRGPLLIHAAKRKPDYWPSTRVRRAFRNLGILYLAQLPLGSIIGKVELYDCRPTLAGGAAAGSPPAWAIDEIDLGDYSFGRYMWMTCGSEIFPIPIPCTGRQRIFDIEI